MLFKLLKMFEVVVEVVEVVQSAKVLWYLRMFEFFERLWAFE